MSIVDNARGDDRGDNGREPSGRNTRVVVAGIAKMWHTGL